jgi:hypothetical protein
MNSAVSGNPVRAGGDFSSAQDVPHLRVVFVNVTTSMSRVWREICESRRGESVANTAGVLKPILSI